MTFSEVVVVLSDDVVDLCVGLALREQRWPPLQRAGQPGEVGRGQLAHHGPQAGRQDGPRPRQPPHVPVQRLGADPTQLLLQIFKYLQVLAFNHWNSLIKCIN